ncbi:MAG TPA: DUF2752 domain-containing protein [Candidatus Brachybacterium merdigallinarum]|jgi:hypothetical protein|nr:DUF2752 domain-containing protein [Candidatus Brachybacterium merdigallinarum]
MSPAARTVGERPAPSVPVVAPRAGLRGAILPLAILAGGTALALLVQVVFDPFRVHVPLCIVNHLTGLDCPGCGGVRAVHALLAGDLLMALRSNVLIVGALPAVAAGYLLWILRRIQGRRLTVIPPNWLMVALVVLIALFTVARNLPMFWFLAPITLTGA